MGCGCNKNALYRDYSISPRAKFFPTTSSGTAGMFFFGAMLGAAVTAVMMNGKR